MLRPGEAHSRWPGAAPWWSRVQPPPQTKRSCPVHAVSWPPAQREGSRRAGATDWWPGRRPLSSWSPFRREALHRPRSTRDRSRRLTRRPVFRPGQENSRSGASPATVQRSVQTAVRSELPSAACLPSRMPRGTQPPRRRRAEASSHAYRRGPRRKVASPNRRVIQEAVAGLFSVAAAAFRAFRRFDHRITGAKTGSSTTPAITPLSSGVGAAYTVPGARSAPEDHP